MKVLADPDRALARGLAAIRQKYQVPSAFPEEVEAAAAHAVQRRPDQHKDRTALPFVTLDPATSTDLDQAFYIEHAGDDLLLHYAIADVAWFVRDGDPLDLEAWRRGATLYFPDDKARLYPASLSEHAASLLPGGARPAVNFIVRVAADGGVKLDGVERIVIENHAKLAYDNVSESDLPTGFMELARRIRAAESARGAVRVDPPEQQVETVEGAGFTLTFRPRLESEENNAALSLACNLAVADALHTHGTGLFRVMAEPDDDAVSRLRYTAHAFQIDWPADMPLKAFEKRLTGKDPREAALMMAIRRAGQGASYAPLSAGEKPWHAAMAATYAHATAPLRRLADRYVIQAALATANGQPVPTSVADAFENLPKVMRRADTQAGQIGRAVIDLAEAVMLKDQIGRTFEAVVIDGSGQNARIQLCDLPIVHSVAHSGGAPGDSVRAKLVAADSDAGKIRFEIV